MQPLAIKFKKSTVVPSSRYFILVFYSCTTSFIFFMIARTVCYLVGIDRVKTVVLFRWNPKFTGVYHEDGLEFYEGLCVHIMKVFSGEVALKIWRHNL
ncbi:MAG: hypothetical protein EAZ47_04660 [Bacteroidetes bacterium]|nr:MAG: hypothetical protein EAY72_02225 [Bacteroidota bacterium]TAF94110.1 MAG: hypothetical protein EAZ47_04660 [Bacteroidota bacterium]